MRAKDIVIGELYRFTDDNDYCWVKPVEIIPPRRGVNKNNFIVVKCLRGTSTNFDGMSFVGYHKPSNLKKDKYRNYEPVLKELK